MMEKNADESLREEGAAAPAQTSEGQKPVVLKDIYGDTYRLDAPMPLNGCRAVHHAGERGLWTLLPIPEYPGTDCAALSDVYVLTRDDGSGGETEVEEILLPASEIKRPDEPGLNGVVLTRDLQNCVRGDRWHPDWLSADTFWRMLARVADGVGLAAERQLFPFKLTRDRLFVDEQAGRMYLAVARANRVTEAMRQDPWLAAALPPELRDPAQETVEAAQTTYALAALVFSLLRDWTPDGPDGALIASDGTGRIPAVETLPSLFPLRDELAALMEKAFSDNLAERPTPDAWRNLLNRCADEMRRRLGGAASASGREDETEEEENETPATAPSDEAAFAAVESPDGAPWLLAAAGQPVREARWRFRAYQLPDDKWPLWDARLDSLTPAQRRQFAVLRFPADRLQAGGEQYALFEDRTPAGAETFQWSDYSDADRLRENLKGALRLTAALIEDIALAQAMGVPVDMFSTRQLVNLPEAAVALCGQNLQGGRAMSPESVAGHLLSKLAGTTLMSPELNRLLAGGQAAPDAWARALRYAADHTQACAGCGRRLMPGAICPDCGCAALVFAVRRDVEPQHEQRALAADGSGIPLSQLYPGAADDPALSLAWAGAQGCFLATNLSGRDWKYIAGGQGGVLTAGQSMPVLPGTRLAILPRQMEITYDWPL